jgi:hypothetical protein
MVVVVKMMLMLNVWGSFILLIYLPWSSMCFSCGNQPHMLSQWVVAGWTRCCGGSRLAHLGRGSWVVLETGTVCGRPSRVWGIHGCVALLRGTDESPVRRSVLSGVSFRWRHNDILYFRGVTLVQLRDYVAELGLLATDAGQGELCFSLGDPHCWSLSPEWRKPHGHCGYSCWYWAVCSLQCSLSGSPMWVVL